MGPVVGPSFSSVCALVLACVFSHGRSLDFGLCPLSTLTSSAYNARPLCSTTALSPMLVIRPPLTIPTTLQPAEIPNRCLARRNRLNALFYAKQKHQNPHARVNVVETRAEMRTIMKSNGGHPKARRQVLHLQPFDHDILAIHARHWTLLSSANRLVQEVFRSRCIRFALYSLLL